MTTQTIAMIAFFILALVAAIGLVQAGAALVKTARNEPEPGSGPSFGAGIFLLRMLPGPTAIFLAVLVLSLLCYLASRWEPLAWLGGICLALALLYAQVSRVVDAFAHWGDNREKRDGDADAVRVPSSPPPVAPAAPKSVSSDPVEAATERVRAGLAAYEVFRLPDQQAPAASPAIEAPQPAPGNVKVKSDADVKAMGGAFFFLGGVAAYFFIYLPIAEAVRGAPNVSYYLELIILIPLAMMIGLFLIVRGAQGYALLQKRPKGLPFILIMVAVLIYAIACIVGMEFIMKSLGYGRF